MKTVMKFEKDKIIGYVWQHVLLLLSMFFMTFGVAFCVRSNLGSGMISSIPMSFMNVILVVAPVLVLCLPDYRPGFRRYIYGLARFIYPRREW